MRALLSLAVTTLLLVAASAVAHADCAGSGMSFWPPHDQPLAPSGLLYVQGYGMDRETLDGLTGAALVSGKQRVPLERVAEHVGAFEVKQIVFRAKTPLPPGSRWRLSLASKTRAPRAARHNGSKYGPVEWTVAEVATPTWTGAPSVGKASYAGFGCGPAIYQAVNLPLSAATGLVEVTLRDGDTVQRYAIGASQTVQLGHGMCSGEFAVSKKGSTYAAEFALLRSDGERIAAPSGVTFPAVDSTASMP